MSKKAVSLELKAISRIGRFILLTYDLYIHWLTSCIINLGMNIIVNT